MANEKKKQDQEKLDLKSKIGYIKDVDVVDEMEKSYLDYAMSVIVRRALPDVRDGLKPVHRRILFSMNKLGLKYNAKFRKCATIVGDVLGNYHPHGDVAVYDSLVRMAQWWSLRYPLVWGQGNFGSMDGDSPAAYRYTEAKMERVSDFLLIDIDKDTVDFRDNYDGSKQEPTVLPSRLPNLLLNGSSGIAVGMATSIPPHNMNELVDAIIYLIDNSEATVEELMEFLKGPDFPTGGAIYGYEDIKNIYSTGRGRVMVRAIAEIVETKKGKKKIVVSEMPYMENKASLVEKIANLVKSKKINGVSDLRDESDKDGVRIVIDLKKEAYANKILNQLYKLTPMQKSFSVNLLALVDGIQPRVMTLPMALGHFIEHRKQVVVRRTKFELTRAQERAHILEGLKKALDKIDQVIATIRASKTKEDAHKNLIKKFKFSDKQATAILDMRLQTLAGLERKKIEDELKEVTDLIKKLKEILGSDEKVMDIIKQELTELKEMFGDARRTKIYKNQVGKLESEALIPNEQVIISVTKGGYIKRLTSTTYKTQKRGGRGVVGATMKEEDVVEHFVVTYNHDDILFFTTTGRVFQSKVYEIPIASRQAKGTAIVNILGLAPEERVSGVITIADYRRGKYLLMATKSGKIKKTELRYFKKVRKSGLIAIRFAEKDELNWVKVTYGMDQVMMVTKKGQAIRFQEGDVRSMGRNAAGVRGIKLRANDEVVTMDVVFQSREGSVLVITAKGYGKRTYLSNYKVQNRGGIGIKTAKITRKNGDIVEAKIIYKEDVELDLVMISIKGQVIRLPIKSVRNMGRATQGVIMMRFKTDDKVASTTLLADLDKEVERQRGEHEPVEEK
ncbi:DNA gyrase subunit A [Patescibacteria group bacterium]|nr:DNA gyrase subunit A [Patescibacteria group bacterium]